MNDRFRDLFLSGQGYGVNITPHLSYTEKAVLSSVVLDDEFNKRLREQNYIEKVIYHDNKYYDEHGNLLIKPGMYAYTVPLHISVKVNLVQEKRGVRALYVSRTADETLNDFRSFGQKVKKNPYTFSERFLKAINHLAKLTHIEFDHTSFDRKHHGNLGTINMTFITELDEDEEEEDWTEDYPGFLITHRINKMLEGLTFGKDDILYNTYVWVEPTQIKRIK